MTPSDSGDTAPLPLEIAFRLNGERIQLQIDPRDRLLDTLRYSLGLTGTKEGCGEGECGACTVYLDGLPVDSCLVPTYQVREREVTTIEALDADALDPFHVSGATQCGACTPGVVMTATWVRDHPDLTATHTLRELMAGNLCRCTGYDGIIDGLERALHGPADPAPGTHPGAGPSTHRHDVSAETRGPVSAETSVEPPGDAAS